MDRIIARGVATSVDYNVTDAVKTTTFTLLIAQRRIRAVASPPVNRHYSPG